MFKQPKGETPSPAACLRYQTLLSPLCEAPASTREYRNRQCGLRELPLCLKRRLPLLLTLVDATDLIVMIPYLR
jgi:hypothetical protein